MILFIDFDFSLEEFLRTPSVPEMSSVLIGSVIMSVGAIALLLAILGNKLRGRKNKEQTLQGAPKESVPVQTEPVAPVITIPPPPPSKTSGLHFIPASLGTAAPQGARRMGNYTRRAPPKRSTATRQNSDEAVG